MLVARRAAEAWGVLSLDELRACGLSRQAVAVRVGNGRLHRVHRGVYAVGHANLPPQARFLAAVKACGRGALLSHVSAAALWGFVATDERRVDVTVPGSNTRVQRDLRVHRSAALTAADVARHRGIPVTSPARTLVDAASALDPQALRRAVREAQALRLVSVGELANTLARLGPRRGTRRLAEIIATGPAPTRSELEDVVLDLLLRGGFEHPEVNVPIQVSDRRVVPDFRWPAARLVLEADGAAWHEHPLARKDDADRQELLERHGERVVRVTWEQATTRPAETLARVRAAGAPVAAEPARGRPGGPAA